MAETKDLIKITDWLWEIPRSFRGDMRVPARIFASEKMLADILKDHSLDQLINVSTLPGIQKYALAMPDIHEGYGFPIGGVAATSYPDGIISPGGIGYDINCGVRLLVSNLNFKEIGPHLELLASAFQREIPAGVGRGGIVKLNIRELDKVLKDGVKSTIGQGYGEKDDLEHLESAGCLPEADPDMVSARAKERGRDQLGTMGAGNHFVEIDRIEQIYDGQQADEFGLIQDQIVILIHTGSRGLGHQVCTDHLKVMVKAMPEYQISLPDLELAGVPFSSPEGTNYFGAMSAAANFAWANRQLITHEVRTAWQKVLGSSGGHLRILYDVAHNIAKIEEHDGKKVIVHRKGATRAFEGQPVIIPGSMGTASYVLVGTKESLKISFGSACHGAGRRMSRQAAVRAVNPHELKKSLESSGIHLRSGSPRDFAEEAPIAYKDVDEVVAVVDQAKIARKVARLKPIAVIKG